MSYFNYLKGFFKWSLFLIPVGSLTYANRHFYFPGLYSCQEYDKATISDHAKEYVQEHDLVSPSITQSHPKKNEHDHFFEKSILHKMNGLDIYSIFLEKKFYKLLVDGSKMTAEEKQEILEHAKLHCVFNTNNRVQGHLGIVHGGFTSTIFNQIGANLAFFVSDFTPTKTRHLNVTYKKPLKVGNEYIIEMGVDKLDGDDIYLKGKVMDGSGNVCTTVDTKFVKTPAQNFYWKEVEREIQTERKAYDLIHLLPQKLFKREGRPQEKVSSDKTQQ